MKPIWKGSIAFGLVNIPIQIFTATESHALGFTLLHEKCRTPLKYHRWCPACKKEVMWDETVKGIEKSKGNYIIFTIEALKKLHPEKTEEIRIVEFVDAENIPVIYLNNHYYLAPLKKSETAYALFVKALGSLNKAAIGHFVMRDKEYVCALQPRDNYLLLTTLHYDYEIRGIKNLAIPKQAKVNPKELKLAQEFVEKLSVDSFDMSQFKDTFAQAIKKRLTQKPAKKGKRIAKGKEQGERARTTKKSSLVDALQANLKIKHPTPVDHGAPGVRARR